ncbi:uncharacterized protein [Musca autumnalis]|uniref:uncharacterized protein n=1 Tax=Musca autumnalis TaxID=221902 RepID=UPI003CF5EAB5
MITDRNKLNFVTIQWLWLLCLILVFSGGFTTTLAHNIAGGGETTQQKQHAAQQIQAQQQQQQQTQQVDTQQQQQQQPAALQIVQPQVESNGPQSQQQDVTVRNFSPRMDYNNNEWRPVGRGDPLKNDPTFDYSPPTLDRVRYWADPDKDKEKSEDVATNVIDAKLKKANPGKNEILLLGVTGDRIRGPAAPGQQHVGHAQAGHGGQMHVMKNAKGETPLLQPKYTSVRRSYYSHQLPTHLMPPPMQPMVPQQQQMTQQSQAQQTPGQSHMQTMGHMVKPAHGEYRHHMAAGPAAATNGGHHSYVSSPAMSASMNVHAKPYHMASSSSTSSQPWMHAGNAQSSSMVTSMPSYHMAKPMGMAHTQQHYSHAGPSHPAAVHDTHHQESVNYLAYTRPSGQNPHMAMNAGSHEYYSPNSIRGAASGHHKSSSSSSSSRKPWIHDLLKKEVVKSIKPTAGPNTYHSEVSIKPSHSYHIESNPMRPQQHIDNRFEPMMAGNIPVSTTTYTPVSFVTTTSTTPATTTTTPAPLPTQGAIYITSSTSTTPSYVTSPSSPPIYTHTSTTTHAPRTTTTLSPTRLLIPNTSNLSYRPTVAPMKMTTDSLFSHYNQPEKPLRGPMYLIIEGHSKVKTYGKDELDPHKPKIVPVISSREPVVRMADPNEQRGTPETFQVKHLHSKTTQPMEKITTTTAKPTANTKTTTKPTTKKPTVTTTTSKPSSTASPKPSAEKIKPASTKKTLEATPTKKPVAANTKTATTTTTPKPSTTVATTKKPAPKLSVTTKPATTTSTPRTTTTTTTTPKPTKSEKPGPTKESKIPPKTPIKGEKSSPNNLNVLDSQKKPSQTGPTAMQGLLSFLDSSLDSLFKEESPLTGPSGPAPAKPTSSSGTTKLKSVTMATNTQSEPNIEARVSTKLQAIKAEDYDDDYTEEELKLMKTTTEYLPRETRQIFDYDQLPESRITGSPKDANSNYEDDLSALGFDDEYEYEEVEEDPTAAGSQLIKRIDALVDDDFTDDDLEALNQARQQTAKKSA